ncbi:MAG: hypothetical protein ACRCW2_05435 [Cellulosilyticaceae bacterium]
MKKRSWHKVVAGVCVLLLAGNTYAFGGYAHWEIADRAAVLKNYGIEEAKHYMSGALMADIGKMSWDSKYTSSDSLAFTQTIMEQGVLSGTYFAEGWNAHYISDTQGAVANISGGPSIYKVKCGWIDKYLRDDQSITTPINGATSAYVNYELIRNTYQSLNGFSPTDTQIDQQISSMYSAFHTAIALSFQGWNSAQKQSIENELNRVVGLLSRPVTYWQGAVDNNEEDDSYDALIKLVNEDDTGELRRQIEALAQNIIVEKVPTQEEGVYEVRVIVINPIEYNGKCEALAKSIIEMQE